MENGHIFALVIAIVIIFTALILSIVAITQQKSSQCGTTIVSLSSFSSVNIGYTGTDSQVILAASAAKKFTPAFSDVDSYGCFFLCTQTAEVKNLFATISNTSVIVSDTAPTVTFAVWKAESGSLDWNITSLIAVQQVSESSPTGYYIFANTSSSFTVNAGDRLALIVSTDSGTDAVSGFLVSSFQLVSA
jgi:hypothetical protein